MYFSTSPLPVDCLSSAWAGRMTPPPHNCVFLTLLSSLQGHLERMPFHSIVFILNEESIMRLKIAMSCVTALFAACGGGSDTSSSTNAGATLQFLASSADPLNNNASTLISITGVTLAKGPDYSSSRTTQAGCTPRQFVAGFSSQLLTSGGTDGFDCGLNLPTATIDPGAFRMNTGLPVTVKLGEAALNERALIALGTFPVGDGRSLAFLGMTLTFNVGGTPVTFNGTAVNFVGGAAAFGDPALIAICENLATADQLSQCVDDEAEDFRVEFDSPGAITVDGNVYTISISPLSFTDRRAPVEITAQVTMEKAVRPN